MVTKEKKLQQQDAIIKAQMKKIAQVEHDNDVKSQLIAEYEARFIQVREAFQQDK
jgi:hypothetical protein